MVFFALPFIPTQAADRTAYDCVITPSQTVDVSSPVSGTLSEVTVDRSDRVAKGQVLARLNAEVETATTALARAKAKLDSEEDIAAVNLKFDGERLNRFLALYGVSMTSSQDKDDAERKVALSHARLQYAKAMRKVRQLELRAAEAHVDQKVIRSPIDGVILKRYKTVSEYIEAQPIVRVAQLDPLFIEAIVPMEQFGQIRPGMHAQVFSDAFHQGPQLATVHIVDQMGDAASGTFGVRLELPNPDWALPAGVKCNVQVLTETTPIENDSATHTGYDKPSPHHAALINKSSTPASASPLNTVSLPLTSGCSSLGPYADESAIQPLLGILDKEHVTYALRKDRPGAKYLLLSPEQENPQQQADLMKRMKQVGVKDMDVVERGKFRGRIALGVFAREENSMRRTTELANLGFSSETHRIRNRQPALWVDIRRPIQDVNALVSRDRASANGEPGDQLKDHGSICPARFSS